MVNRCDWCGKFISPDDIGSHVFVPDSPFSTEKQATRCKKCTVNHGRVEEYELVDQLYI